jgi:hypothetical protein
MEIGNFGQDAYHERQFLHLEGVANLYVICDLHPRWAHAIQFVLNAFRHDFPLFRLVNSAAPGWKEDR